MRVATLILVLLAFAGAAVPDPRWVVVTVSLDDRVRPEGHYYVAFSSQEGLLQGPEPDGTGWVAYVLLHRERFYFGTLSNVDPPPRLFRFTRPPVPYNRARLDPDQRGWGVEVPVTALTANGRTPRWVKVNVVAADGDRRVLDALGRGAEDRLGFVSLDLSREVYRGFTDDKGDAPPGYDLLGGTVAVKVP